MDTQANGAVERAKGETSGAAGGGDLLDHEGDAVEDGELVEAVDVDIGDDAGVDERMAED